MKPSSVHPAKFSPRSRIWRI